MPLRYNAVIVLSILQKYKKKVNSKNYYSLFFVFTYYVYL